MSSHREGIARRLLLLLLAAPRLAPAQDSLPADPMADAVSLGLPRPVRWYGGLGVGLETGGPGQRLVGRGMFGGSRDITNAVPGLVAAGGELYAGTHARRAEGGARVFLANNAAGVQAGLDYSLRLGRADAVVTVLQPLRRGGIVLPGAGLRVDWIPERSTLSASLTVPLFQVSPGRTRPRRADVAAPPAPAYRARGIPQDAALELALARLREATLWTARVTVPFLAPGPPDRSDAEMRRLLAYLRTLTPGTEPASTQAVASYHETLDQAFAVALGGPAERVAAAARRTLLDEVLIAYDRDLGRIRRPAVLAALRRRAATAFATWVETAGVPAERRRPVVGAYERLLAAVQEAADTAERLWGDSRLVWLPLQYALRPAEHDTQAEVDRLIERLTGSPFERGNDIVYATDERFHAALQRSIAETREYHVLWVHDFAGRSPRGVSDTVAGRVVLTYLDALTAAAERYDWAGRVPLFLLFLDQYYYGRSRSSRWLALLQDPLGHRITLPARERAMQWAVRAAQARLRSAVAGSSRLQAARRRHGDRWLRRRFSVHVSVTHPPDPSFRGPRGRGILVSGMPDDIMRDHRKMAIADVTEADPTRGIAILTGLGVGEHYARFRWLDRTLVLRGPAAAALKREAHDLLLSQGVRERDIPAVLRAVPAPSDGERRVLELERRAWSARVAVALNATGYGAKHASAAKAALYTLMPAGCTIVAADPQWLSRFWAGTLLGTALRGCRVLVIGPARHNAPFSTSFVQSTLQRDLFLRLIWARATLAEPLRLGGGRVEIGLFRVGLGTYNVPGGVRGVRDGLRQNPFLREVLAFDPSVWDLFEHADSLILALGESAPIDSTSRYHPRFHLKTQFFASGPAVREALGRPEWRDFFVRRIGERLHESPAGTDITLHHLEPLRPYLDSRPAAGRERQVLYLELGSHNQDPRSFMLDGEALAVVAGDAALIAAGDMLLLAAVGTDWLHGQADLDRHFADPGNARTDAARAAEPLF